MHRELYLLNPYRLPTHHTLMLAPEDAAVLLNGYLSLWHPAALRGAVKPPEIASAYDHERPEAGRQPDVVFVPTPLPVVEKMLEMEVPDRAQWIRMLIAEWNRILNHLMFVGSYALELGAITPMFYAFREREDIQHLLESATGGRLHFTYNQIGGVKVDLPKGFLRQSQQNLATMRKRLPDYFDLVLGNEIFQARTKGVGPLSTDVALSYGVSGPTLQATGIRHLFTYSFMSVEPHKYPRLAHVGDRTGLELIRTLQDHTTYLGVQVHMEHTVVDLVLDSGLPHHLVRLRDIRR